MNQPLDAHPTATTPLPACGNCGAPLHGPFCHACGQPQKGMIRHLSSVLADVGDTIFNVDSRIFRSLPPLFFRPGFLTTEYFLGRRTRYVTPFRLFFFLCILAFFVIQLSLNLSNLRIGGDDGIDNAQTAAEVHKRSELALQQLAAQHQAAEQAGKTAKSADKASVRLQSRADRRLAWLEKRDAAVARGEKPPPDPTLDAALGNLPTLHIDWLPEFANARLQAAVVHAKENALAARQDPGHLLSGVFALLPQTLFVLMPLFALLLKVTYLFKRRLYMEHFMVALHSHAFIFLALLLLALLELLTTWTATAVPAARTPLHWLSTALWAWLPLYLLLMQKRIYGQGWIMTSLKYAFVGLCYVVILSFGLAAAAILSLALN